MNREQKTITDPHDLLPFIVRHTTEHLKFLIPSDVNVMLKPDQLLGIVFYGQQLPFVQVDSENDYRGDIHSHLNGIKHNPPTTLTLFYPRP